MAGWSLILAFLLTARPTLAQVPASGTLSDGDWPLFRSEVARIEESLRSAPDKGAVTYQMARTWASAKQWPETMQWLRRAADLRVGLDPSRDSIFAELLGTQEFDEVLGAVRQATPAVSHSSSAFLVPEGDLVPESVAYDPKAKYFYFGSMRKGEVLRCSATGLCSQFANRLGTVLGVKVFGSSLWLLNNSDNQSELIQYDLVSGRETRRYAVAGPGHLFNDLAIGSAGDVYLTDTRAGVVWHLAAGAADLAKLPEPFASANGIALSPDGRLLFVSTFPDGITVLDLTTNVVVPIARPADLCLAMIDGLYFYRGSLIAIQNGFMTPRVARFTLSRDLRTIERFEVLERRNPLFDGVTTGVVIGREFFYMANIQDEKKSGFRPITMLKVRI